MEEWRALTSDKWVLDIVSGFKIPFWSKPFQKYEPKPFNLSKQQSSEFQQAVDDLIEKEVIELSSEEHDQFISNIFIRPKPNGKVRLILDLTELNKFLILQHFKLENLDTALQMVQKEAFMSTIDLQDAYFSVKIHTEDRKFLKFRWNSKLWRFRAVPMGLACAPYIFTKILVPLFTNLRESGKFCFCYLDDVFITDNSEEQCRETTKLIVLKLKKLGFKIHEDKSQFTPKKLVKFLGFMIDSIQMKVFLPSDKIDKMQRVCQNILQSQQPKIQDVASAIGLMNSYQKATDYGNNYIKRLEIDKIRALKFSQGDFNANMQVSSKGKQDLWWWLRNAPSVDRKFDTKSPSITLTTDASNEGWGAVSGHKTAQGKWLETEQDYHINEKELLAVLFGLKTVCTGLNEVTIRVLSDNTTTVSYINKMGGVRSPRCNKIAYKIWKICEDRSLWLIAAHIPGLQNVIADDLSRKFSNNVEWSLNNTIFNIICKRWGSPTIDLFASRWNTKLHKFCSWKPDPDAWRIDAFSFKWDEHFYFIFPPFRLVGRVWKKMIDEKTHGILVIPRWPSQSWFPKVIASARRILWFKKKSGNLLHRKDILITQNLTNIPLAACLY